VEAVDVAAIAVTIEASCVVIKVVVS
jgi:hypothetical protein